MKKPRPINVKQVGKAPYFGRADLTSDDRYGRVLNNYAKKSPYNVTGSQSVSLLKRK